MADGDRVRIEIAFDGGQTVSELVSNEQADELERALGSATQDTVSLEVDDGSYAIALKRVIYVKRFARDSRVGFGA